MNRVFEVFEKVELVLAGFCLTISAFLIFIAAVARSISMPINWSIDISLFLFAWATFLSADIAFRKGQLVNMDIVIKRIPPKASKVIQAGIYVAVIIFMAMLLFYGTKLSIISRKRPFQGIPGISYSWITMSLPVGAALIIRTTVEKIISLFDIITDSNGNKRQQAD